MVVVLVVLVAASAVAVVGCGDGVGGGRVNVGVLNIASGWVAVAGHGVGRGLDATDRRMPRDCGTADRAQRLVCRGVVEILAEAARVEEVLAFEPVKS